MKLRDFLNEYEMDYAQAACRDKEIDISGLKKAKVVVLGDGSASFSKTVIYSFLNFNDEMNMNVQVKYVPIRGGKTDSFLALKKNREDFEAAETMEALEWADMVVMTGLCNQPIPETPEFFVQTIELYTQAFEKCAKCKKVILLSDYRVFGNTSKDYVASEYEMPAFDFADEAAGKRELLMSLESLCSVYGKQKGFSYQILRCAMAAGAYVEFDNNLLYQLAEAVSAKQQLKIARSRNKYSFVYVNDIIRTIFYGLFNLPMNKTYHVAGPDSTMTTGSLVELLYQNFPEDTHIELEHAEKDPEYGVAMSMDKLLLHFWLPMVSVEDAMILLIKSKSGRDETFLFDGSYQGKLQTIHDILLAYLLEIDRICKKHNIKYFLAGGTLLGAIRHKGFIPWDDDADVMMLREDYNKFLKVVQEELPGNLKLQTPKTEKLNHNVFTKIRIDNTMFATKFTGRFPNMHNGIFMDVLSHDQTANHKWSQKLHLYATMVFRALVQNKWRGSIVKFESAPPAVAAIAEFIKKLLPMRALEWLQDTTITWYQRRRNAKYLYDGMGRNLKRGAFPKKWLDEVIYVDFEGHSLPVPKEYDNYLTYLYGDYMQMIPVSERRVSHDIVLMDLGEYTDFRL